MAKISVIVPVFNIETYLPKCLRSICSQTFSDLEIILVDDGSTDRSGDICDRFAKEDSRIVVIHKQNEGLVSARKTGVGIARGEYVTYVDGDDWIDPDTYENMYYDIIENKADIVVYEHFESTEGKDIQIHHGITAGYYDREALLRDVFPNMVAGEHLFEWKLYTSVWDALFERSILEKVQMKVDNRLTIGEDIACIYPALLEANSIYISTKSFYHYRQTPFSMVKKVSEKGIERERYEILFYSVKETLVNYNMSGDVLRQWCDFALFLMVPRSDQLFDGIENLEYIFPFTNIRKGMKIALYCAGTYGQRLYSYINENEIADIVLWVDRNYVELQKLGLPVTDPENLTRYEFDAIIIANMFYDSRFSIKRYIDSLGLNVPIGIVDEEFVRSEEVKKGFRIH